MERESWYIKMANARNVFGQLWQMHETDLYGNPVCRAIPLAHEDPYEDVSAAQEIAWQRELSREPPHEPVTTEVMGATWQQTLAYEAMDEETAVADEETAVADERNTVPDEETSSAASHAAGAQLTKWWTRMEEVVENAFDKMD